MRSQATSFRLILGENSHVLSMAVYSTEQRAQRDPLYFKKRENRHQDEYELHRIRLGPRNFGSVCQNYECCDKAYDGAGEEEDLKADPEKLVYMLSTAIADDEQDEQEGGNI